MCSIGGLDRSGKLSTSGKACSAVDPIENKPLLTTIRSLQSGVIYGPRRMPKVSLLVRRSQISVRLTAT